jgi:hypothetical protein
MTREVSPKKKIPPAFALEENPNGMIEILYP